MKNCKQFLAVLCVLCLLLTSPDISKASEDKAVCSGHPDYKPFMWQYGKTLVGAGPELIRTIFNELGQPFVIEYKGPWARVQEMVQRNRIDFLVGAYDNVQRRQYMIYLSEYALDPTSVFVWKGHVFPFKSREDLIGKRGVTMHGDSFGDDLDAFIRDKLQMARVYDSNSLFKKLSSKTMDYILWGDFPCRMNAAMQGFENNLIKLSPSLTVEKMHITVSKKSRFAKLVPAMNRMITRFKAHGQIKTMLDKYSRLYVASEHVTQDQKKTGTFRIFVDGTLKPTLESVRVVSNAIWPGAVIKLTETSFDIQNTIQQPNDLVYAPISRKPEKGDLNWAEVMPGQGFVFSREFDPGLIALWQLQFEAMMNSGKLNMNMAD